MEFVPLTIRGGPAVISLTRGLQALVSIEDWPRLVGRRWYALVTKKWVYAARDDSGDERRVFMHRVILGVPKGTLVDHRDRNTLNNVRGNLRPATVAQNGANSTLRKNVSRYRGVSWHAASRKWRAELRSQGQRYIGGHFSRRRDAALAYDRLAIQHHGAFATLNFPAVALPHIRERDIALLTQELAAARRGKEVRPC